MAINIYDNNGYLDWPKIMKVTRQCPFIFCVGGRGTGKTYGALKMVYDSHKPFLYLRRTKIQFELTSKTETNPFKALEMDNKVAPIATKSVAKDLTGLYTCEYEDDTEKRVLDGEPFGYMSALSTFSNLRGMSFEEIEYILFDEFIPEPHERPIKNEAAAFLNLVETVNRNRELKGRDPVKVICLANANDIANPLYIELDIVKKSEQMMEKHKSLSIDEKRGLCMIHLFASPISERKKHTALYKLTDNKNSEFNQMALNNRFYKDESALIKSCPIDEYVPIVTVSNITIYQHKSRREYYVSTHKTGTCREYGTSYAEKKRFMNNHNSLWIAYLQNKIVFEEYLGLVLFEQAFDPSK